MKKLYITNLQNASNFLTFDFNLKENDKSLITGSNSIIPQETECLNSVEFKKLAYSDIEIFVDDISIGSGTGDVAATAKDQPEIKTISN